jgi:hypothetical protein
VGAFLLPTARKMGGTMQLNHHMFFFEWQMLHDATRPKDLTDHWKVDGVEWEREEHSFLSQHYSTHIHVHRLTNRRGEKIDWQLMVVIEDWWGPDRKSPIRSTRWCKNIIGDSKKIVTWLKKQDSKLEANQASDNPKYVNMPEEKIAPN